MHFFKLIEVQESSILLKHGSSSILKFLFDTTGTIMCTTNSLCSPICPLLGLSVDWSVHLNIDRIRTQPAYRYEIAFRTVFRTSSQPDGRTDKATCREYRLDYSRKRMLIFRGVILKMTHVLHWLAVIRLLIRLGIRPGVGMKKSSESLHPIDFLKFPWC